MSAGCCGRVAFGSKARLQAAQRVRSNLALGPAQLDPEAAVWISGGKVPPGRLGISLDDAAALLGPHSFGFLNNVDGIAPLAAPMAERPRLGRVALVVPRRDALPELPPLLEQRLLGVSWLISVGDGDPPRCCASWPTIPRRPGCCWHWAKARVRSRSWTAWEASRRWCCCLRSIAIWRCCGRWRGGR
jgi:hypothetical protein